MPKPREKPCVTLRCMLFALLWSWIGVVFVALRHMGPASGSSASWESATASLAAQQQRPVRIEPARAAAASGPAVAAGAPPPPPPPPRAAAFALKPGPPAAPIGEDVVDGLSVPKFWYPPQGTDYDTVGSYVDGEPTIFLMVASYRDFQCRDTVVSALERAQLPNRIRVGVVQQNAPGDVDCATPDTPCDSGVAGAEDHTLCARASQVEVYHMDAEAATGPVFARHIGHRMYRGESFVLQVDAHCVFVNRWDELLVTQWRETRNERGVLTSYLTDLQGSVTPEGDSKRTTRPIMCNSAFEGAMPGRYLRHGAQPEEEPSIAGMPQLEPFWAAGFAFSRGHFVLRVPYDCCQPMLFQGEEISIGMRGWTFGYDYYAPRASVVFHEYAQKSARRNAVHHFWEQGSRHLGEDKRSARRAMALIGMAPDIDPATYDTTDAARYGMGTERPVQWFYDLFLIDVHKRETAPGLCKFVKTGVMHRTFQPHLRADGLGIDYSGLLGHDVRGAIEVEMAKDRPNAKLALERAMSKRNLAGVQNALNMAERCMLQKADPEIMERGRALLKELRANGARAGGAKV